MTMLALSCVAASWTLLLMLCLGDPKRRRALRLPSSGQGQAARRLTAAAACVPGLICALTGDAAALLIWLGGTGVLGWLTTIWFSRRARADE